MDHAFTDADKCIFEIFRIQVFKISIFLTLNLRLIMAYMENRTTPCIEASLETRDVEEKGRCAAVEQSCADENVLLGKQYTESFARETT